MSDEKGNSIRFICELPTGLHARPASLLAETARRHRATVTFTNEATGASADGRSVLSLIALDVQRGHGVVVEAMGEDAAGLIEAIGVLVKGNFGESTALVAPVEQGEFVARVPTPLRRFGARLVVGRPVCAGVGEGIAVIAGGLHFEAEMEGSGDAPASSPDGEQASVLAAIGEVRAEIEHDLGRLRDGGVGGVRAELLRAHLGIVDDPALLGRIEGAIRAGRSAPGAVVEASRHFAGKLGASTSAYIRERAADIQEVCRRVLGKLDAEGVGEAPIVLSGPSVVVADSLGVNQLMALDREHLRGLVLGDVGRTSHVVILARSMMVPTLIGVHGATRAVRAGAGVVVDAIGGFLVTDAGDAVCEYYRRDGAARSRRRERIGPLLNRRGVTRDGVSLEVAANATTAGEIRGAMEVGADSIGLLRTELLFLDRCEAPSEEEQFEMYRAAVEAANADTDRSEPRSVARGNREVIIRTLDIGGDKPAPYLELADEENPFLGCRGVRLYHKFPELLRAQLRAICRASAMGTVKVMAPMVATVAEARWFCERIAGVQAELSAEGVEHDPNMAIGIMIEVPSAAMIVDQLAKVVDFVSVGTNDLCQYVMAADRGNKDVAGLNDPLEPALLRVLERIVSAAREHGVWAGLCGEMGSDPLYLPLMVGLGLDEVSVSAGAVEGIKMRLAGLDSRECREVLERAIACESATEVREMLRGRGVGGEGRGTGVQESPVHRDLVIIDCDATTREGVIQELVGALHVAGRTDDPRAVEEAVWVREAKGVTALGFGFAIPHGQTDAVGGPSIAVANLRTPVEWGGPEPVRGVIMLTVPESDAEKTHLKLLAKLARRLMHEGFRESLLGARNVETVVGVLERELELR